MAQFGQTGNNGSTSASSADSDLLNKATDPESEAPSSGTLQKIVGRFWVDSGSTLARGVIYDASGNLLALGDEITINNTTEQALDFPFSGAEQIPIVMGTSYAYGIIWDDPGAVNINWSRQGTSAASWKNSITYPTPADPHGSGTISGPIDMYVEYESGTPADDERDAHLTGDATATAERDAIQAGGDGWYRERFGNTTYKDGGNTSVEWDGDGAMRMQ